MSNHANVVRQWHELFPDGRTVFYEGDNPDAFAKEMKDRFEIDVHNDDGWNEKCGYRFYCPAEHLDLVYGSGKYPMGS